MVRTPFVVRMVVVRARESEVGLARADEAVRVAVGVVREAVPEKVERERADARLRTHNAQAAREAMAAQTWGFWRSGGLYRRPIVAKAAMASAWRGPFSPGPRVSAVSMTGLLLNTDARVEQVLQKDVLDVLRADAARTQSGKAGLHQEDQCTCAARAERASAPRAFPVVRERRRENGNDSRTGPHEVEGVDLRLERVDLSSQLGDLSS